MITSVHLGNQLTGCISTGLRDVQVNDLSALGLPFCGEAVASIPTLATAERAALEALYEATNGANWKRHDNWLSESPLGEWHGVHTDANGHVDGLDVPGNQLSGEIPPELGNLAGLTILQLAGNQLTGKIPPELGRLSKLEWLILQANQLSGEIPPELGGLSNLRLMNLSINQLTGPIPPELGNLANLTGLDLGYNQLSGEIPPELGNLTELTSLSLESNQLSGCVPASLFDEFGWPDFGDLPSC